VGSLPNLTELNVNRNNLSTLSFLACCPKIQKLFAASNAFTSVSPLAE
jgi:Leucine-rich repeat (LRR) protein